MSEPPQEFVELDGRRFTLESAGQIPLEEVIPWQRSWSIRLAEALWPGTGRKLLLEHLFKFLSLKTIQEKLTCGNGIALLAIVMQKFGRKFNAPGTLNSIDPASFIDPDQENGWDEKEWSFARAKWQDRLQLLRQEPRSLLPMQRKRTFLPKPQEGGTQTMTSATSTTPLTRLFSRASAVLARLQKEGFTSAEELEEAVQDGSLFQKEGFTDGRPQVAIKGALEAWRKTRLSKVSSGSTRAVAKTALPFSPTPVEVVSGNGHGSPLSTIVQMLSGITPADVRGFAATVTTKGGEFGFTFKPTPSES